MAFDPTIPLQAGANIPQIDLVGSLSKAQGLLSAQQAERASKAAEDISKAQLPGVQADSANKTREEDARKLMAAAREKFTRIDPSTGKRNYDYMGLSTYLADNGFQDYAQGFAGKALANRSAEIQNDAGELTNADKVKKYLGEVNELNNQAFSQAVLLASRTPDPAEQKRILERFYDGTRKTAEVLGSKVSPQIANELQQLNDSRWTASLGGVNSANWPGATPDVIKRAAELPIGAQQAITNQVTQTQLAQTGEQIAQSGAAQGVSADDRNPNSPSSKAARAAALAAGVDPAIVGNLSKAQLAANPITSGIMANSPLSAGVRVTQLEDAAKLSADKQLLDEAVKLRTSKAVASLPTRPGSIVADKWNQYIAQSPELARIQAATDAYNLANPNAQLSIPKDGLDAVLARLSAASRQYDSIIKSKKQVATSPTVGQATAPKAEEPMYKPGAVVTRNGKTYTFIGGDYRDSKNWK